MTKTKPQRELNHQLGLAIICAIAVVQGISLAQAFIALDAKTMDKYPALSVVFLFGGVVLGFAIEGGIAYAAAKYPTLHSKKELRVTEIGIGTLVAITPIILTPIRLYTMDQAMKASMHPLIAGAIVFLLSGAPSLVTIVTAVIDRDDFTVAVAAAAPAVEAGKKATAPDAPATAPEAPAVAAAAPAVEAGKKATAPDAGYPRACGIDDCAAILKSKHAVGPHMRRWHPDHCTVKIHPQTQTDGANV